MPNPPMLTVDRVDDRRSWGNVARNFQPSEANSARRPNLTIAARLLELERELAALRQRVATLERDPADRLVLAIAAGADGPFTASELLARSAREPELAAALGTRDSQQVGWKLRALVGRSVGPYQIQRSKRASGGRLWIVLVDTA